jgi:hypothetical protein
MTLRLSLFLLLTFAILIPTALFGVWTYKQSYQNELDGVSDCHLLLAKNVRGTLTAYNKSVDITFRMLFRNAYLGNKVLGAPELLGKVSINHLCIISPSTGKVIAQVDNAAPPALLWFLKRDWRFFSRPPLQMNLDLHQSYPARPKNLHYI